MGGRHNWIPPSAKQYWPRHTWQSVRNCVWNDYDERDGAIAITNGYVLFIQIGEIIISTNIVNSVVGTSEYPFRDTGK
ncbi:Uncharacterised protein [Serratia fonticola]|nr:Uncharacterised protein [Serratia fonticola]